MSSINTINVEDIIKQNIQCKNSSLSYGTWLNNKLNLPYYSQKDSRWSDIKYFDLSKNYYKVEQSASSYVSLAMILSGLNYDISINPKNIIEFILGERDTNNDQVMDTNFIDRNFDGICDMKDALSQSLNSGASKKSALLSNEFATHYNVTISECNSDIISIQDKIDDLNVLLVKIPGHYFVITPSNEEYSENGKNHYKLVVFDPYFEYRNGVYTMDEFISKIYCGKLDYVIAYKRNV